jgi:hypothetical protein
VDEIGDLGGGIRGDWSKRMSADESALARLTLKRWMERLGITSIDGFFKLSGAGRSSIYRWLDSDAEDATRHLPIEEVRDLAGALAEKAGTDEPLQDIEAILKCTERRISYLRPLVAEFRKRRASFQRAYAAIRAARYRIVPEDESV